MVIGDLVAHTLSSNVADSLHVEWLLAIGAGTALCLYLAVALAAGRDPRGWSQWRTASFAIGIALMITATVPPLSTAARTSFAGHVLTHLMIGMFAPLALVLAAPMTLLLRSVSVSAGRRISSVLRSRPVWMIANPVAALMLTAGGLFAIYLTPLYEFSIGHPLAHTLIHLHVLLTGCLFAWVIAGADPAPHRSSVQVRLAVLAVAIAAHAGLSQLMYADLWVRVDAPIDDLRAGATLMYYGGDIAELLLAIALLVTWKPRPRRSVRTNQTTWHESKQFQSRSVEAPATSHH